MRVTCGMERIHEPALSEANGPPTAWSRRQRLPHCHVSMYRGIWQSWCDGRLVPYTKGRHKSLPLQIAADRFGRSSTSHAGVALTLLPSSTWPDLLLNHGFRWPGRGDG